MKNEKQSNMGELHLSDDECIEIPWGSSTKWGDERFIITYPSDHPVERDIIPVENIAYYREFKEQK